MVQTSFTVWRFCAGVAHDCRNPAGVETGSYQGLLAPAGTPRDVVAKINAEVTKILATQEMRDKLGERRVTGSAGGGMVSVEMNGHSQVLACRIDPAVFQTGDREMLEDLIVAATNLALEKVKQVAAEEMVRIGFALKAYPHARLMHEVRAFALHISEKGPLALRGAKRIVHTRLAPGLREARQLSDEMRAKLEWSHDVDEAIAAHREGRKPRFTGK